MNNSRHRGVRKVVLCCADGEHALIEQNRGAEAVLLTTASLLRSVYPEAEFVTTIQCSEELARQTGWRVLRNRCFRTKHFSVVTTMHSILRLAGALMLRPLPADLRRKVVRAVGGRKMREYHSADLVVHIGMDLFSEDFGLITVVEHSLDVFLAVALGKPVVFWAESIGPFRRRAYRALAKSVLKRVALTMVREEVSERNVLELGIADNRVHHTADPAFLLEPQMTHEARGFIDSVPRKDGDSSTGVCLTLGYLAGGMRPARRSAFLRDTYRTLQYLLPEPVMLRVVRLAGKLGLYSSPLDINTPYIKRLAALVDTVLAETPGPIIFVPHISGGGPVMSEQSLHEHVRQITTQPQRIVVLPSHMTAAEIKAIIGMCDLFIGFRMHANIAALSQCIPTVGISYSHKFRGIMQALGQAQRVQPALDPMEAAEAVRNALDNAATVRAELELRIPGMHAAAHRNAELCATAWPADATCHQQ